MLMVGRLQKVHSAYSGSRIHLSVCLLRMTVMMNREDAGTVLTPLDMGVADDLAHTGMRARSQPEPSAEVLVVKL